MAVLTFDAVPPQSLKRRPARGPSRHVQAHPDRQSRRDRLPRSSRPRGGWGSRPSRSIPRPTATRCMSRWPTRRSRIGPPPAADSYLSIDKIVAACRQTGAEAVHPGYGFLSERAAFAEALEAAGIVFIGPNPSAIAAMGDKIESQEGGGRGQGLHRSRPSRRDRGRRRRRCKIADEIGYPVMIKASAGGGGKGMRIAHSRRRGGGRLRARALGGEVVVRRRPRVHREVHRRPAPHRDPGAGRQARQRHPSRRARMLDPAPQPEGGRGGAVAAARRRDAQGDGRAGGRAGEGRRLRLRRHGRVRRRAGQAASISSR